MEEYDDDILGYELSYELKDWKEPPAEPLPVPTGLNDEDDARRYLARTFNAGFHCRRCDGNWEQEHSMCPVCSQTMGAWAVGAIGAEAARTRSEVTRKQRAAWKKKRKTKAPWQG